MRENEDLDVVVRFHDVRRLRELERAIFSIVVQSFRPINILLTVQRFTPEELAITRETLAPVLELEVSLSISIINWNSDEPLDGRSALINCGIQVGQSRYLAFLDYDDLLYDNAYHSLSERLRKTQAAIAFGRICVRNVDVYSTHLHVNSKSFPLLGSNLWDLLERNFCPIHSFMIDRSRITPQDLYFDTSYTLNEDYDFLIRICAKYIADFSLADDCIGCYHLKNDGSNSILTTTSATADRIAAWDDAVRLVEVRRQTTLVSTEVQLMLGLKPLPQATVRSLLSQNLRR